MYPSLSHPTHALLLALATFLPLLLGIAHSLKKKERSEKIDLLLVYYLFISAGLQSLIIGIFYLTRSPGVTGLAYLGLGILGISSPWLSGRWRSLFATSYGLLLLFFAIIKIFIYPIDSTFWFEFLLPTALLVLSFLFSQQMLSIQSD